MLPTLSGWFGKSVEDYPWLVYVARVGYVAKGLVYIIVGLLTTLAVVGQGGSISDKTAALQMVVAQPYGMLALGLLTLGLGAYVVWRLAQAMLNAPQADEDAQSWAARATHALNGLFYGALAYTGIEILTGASVTDSEAAAEDWTARLLSWPLGPWVVAGLGLAIIGYGLYELYRAYSASFKSPLQSYLMSEDDEAFVTIVGRFGLTARSLVYGVIGSFLIRAAQQYNPQAAGGLREALDALAAGPLGLWALGATALGLTAYGLFQLTQARYRRFD